MFDIRHTAPSPQSAIQSTWGIYQNSFPACERRTFEQYVQQCCRDPRFYPAQLYYQNQCIGLLWYWKCPDFTYIEHFAIDAQYRNQGFGSQLLSQFTTLHPNIILEVEPPTNPLTQRRIAFYQRHQFQLTPITFIHPGYGTPNTPYPLQLMTSPSWTHAQCKKFLTFLFDDVLQKPFTSIVS